jgi:hypothetical protein
MIEMLVPMKTLMPLIDPHMILLVELREEGRRYKEQQQQEEDVPRNNANRLL